MPAALELKPQTLTLTLSLGGEGTGSQDFRVALL
jgi:hypothetical protein